MIRRIKAKQNPVDFGELLDRLSNHHSFSEIADVTGFEADRLTKIRAGTLDAAELQKVINLLDMFFMVTHETTLPFFKR